MVTQNEQALFQFQENNCVGCVFTDPNMLRKGACCTYPGKIQVEGGVCLNRRPTPSMTPAQSQAQLRQLDEVLKEAQVITGTFAMAPPHYRDGTRYVDTKLGKLRYTVKRLMSDLPGGNHGQNS